MVLSCWINLSTESLEQLLVFQDCYTFQIIVILPCTYLLSVFFHNLSQKPFFSATMKSWRQRFADIFLFYEFCFFFLFPVFCCTSEFSKQHVHFFQRQENFLDITGKRKLRKAMIIASLCSCAYGFFRIHVQNLQVFSMLWSFMGFRAMNFLCKNLAFYVKEHCVMTKGKHRTGKLKMWKFHRVAYPRYGMHFKTWSCTCFWNRYF